eukprot:361322-Chlamydomonas_euryale.AAC.3
MVSESALKFRRAAPSGAAMPREPRGLASVDPERRSADPIAGVYTGPRSRLPRWMWHQEKSFDGDSIASLSGQMVWLAVAAADALCVRCGGASVRRRGVPRPTQKHRVRRPTFGSAAAAAQPRARIRQ